MKKILSQLVLMFLLAIPRITWGIFIMFIGACIWGGSVFLVLSSISNHTGALVHGLICAILMPFVLPLGYALFRHGKRYLRFTWPIEILSSYILYLRPFDVDQRGQGLGWLFQKPWWERWLLFLDQQAPSDRFEEEMTAALRKVAPLVGLSSPEDKLPPLGATRIDKIMKPTWMETVSNLAQKAAFVIVLPGARPGIAAEMEWLLTNLEPHKVIILFPPLLTIEWELQWKTFARQVSRKFVVLGTKLEKFIDMEESLTSIGVSFDPDWNPRLIYSAYRDASERLFNANEYADSILSNTQALKCVTNSRLAILSRFRSARSFLWRFHRAPWVLPCALTMILPGFGQLMLGRWRSGTIWALASMLLFDVHLLDVYIYIVFGALAHFILIWWRLRQCPHCSEPNLKRARYCSHCHERLHLITSS